MAVQTTDSLPELYERDETAWLDIMAELVREQRVEAIDFPHLAEYLEDMAGRNRREVESRMIVLLEHLLKWSQQPKRRSRSRRSTIVTQQQELIGDADQGVLRNHAASVLDRAYAKAVKRAAAETGLPSDRWPSQCPYTLDQLLTTELPEEIA